MKEQIRNPWSRVKTKKGKLVGMLTDELARTAMGSMGEGKSTSQSGLQVVRTPKPLKRH